MILKNLLKLFNFFEEFEKRLKKEYLYEEPFDLEIELVKKSDINNNDIYNIEALYKYDDTKNKTISTYKDKNILINGTNSNQQGFKYMILNINSKIKEIKEKRIKLHRLINILKFLGIKRIIFLGN